MNARARRAVAWDHEVPRVKSILDTLESYKIKPHENELRFVRDLVDRGKFEHSWLPTDPNANVKRVRPGISERGWNILRRCLHSLEGTRTIAAQKDCP